MKKQGQRITQIAAADPRWRAIFEEDGAHDWFLWEGHIRRFLSAVLGPIPTK